jgi:membrane protein involved in colicin uptake
MATQSKEEVKIQIGDEVRILEGEELVAFNNMRAEMQAEAKALKDAAEAEAKAKAEAKQAIADRLGLTADELKLLLG